MIEYVYGNNMEFSLKLPLFRLMLSRIENDILIMRQNDHFRHWSNYTKAVLLRWYYVCVSFMKCTFQSYNSSKRCVSMRNAFGDDKMRGQNGHGLRTKRNITYPYTKTILITLPLTPVTCYSDLNWCLIACFCCTQYRNRNDTMKRIECKRVRE